MYYIQPSHRMCRIDCVGHWTFLWHDIKYICKLTRGIPWNILSSARVNTEKIQETCGLLGSVEQIMSKDKYSCKFRWRLLCLLCLFYIFRSTRNVFKIGKSLSYTPVFLQVDIFRNRSEGRINWERELQILQCDWLLACGKKWNIALAYSRIW